ncbi:MAG: acylphosphatase [Thermodesulfovibrionales bacterium]
MPSARAHVTVRGRVQGVFYRGFTEDTAHSLGLRGWVRNRPDGTVEAVFEGERAAIEQAVRECRKGPPAARVDGVDVRWEEPTDEFDTFSVKYF